MAAPTGHELIVNSSVGVESFDPATGKSLWTGETIVIKAGRTFDVIARNKLNGHFVASPAAGGGKVFLRADDRLFAVGR